MTPENLNALADQLRDIHAISDVMEAVTSRPDQVPESTLSHLSFMIERRARDALQLIEGGSLSASPASPS